MSNINNSSRELRRSVGEKSVEAFARLYFPHYLSNKTCSFHEEMYRLLLDVTNKRDGHMAIAAPRGSAKSAITSLVYPIWAVCYNRERYIVLISNTGNQAVTLLSHIKGELEANKYLVEDFPDVCEIGQKPSPERWSKDEIITRNGVKITALGAGQKIRGRRNKESRPSLIIVDDIENETNTQSAENREKLEDWFNKAVLKAGDQKTNIIVIGTISHTDSLLARLTGELQMPGWQKRKYKSVISWAIHQELWDEWSAILNYRSNYKDKQGKDGAEAFFQDNKEVLLKGTQVLWQDREDYYSLMLMKDKEGDPSFNSEKQNEPIDLRDCYFNPEEFYYWMEKYLTQQEILQAIGPGIEIYGSCDPSLGKQGKGGDFSAIVIVAKDPRTGILYVLEADIRKQKPEELIETIITYCSMYKCQKFGFESNQFQDVIAGEIERRINERMSFPVEIVRIINRSNKIARIQSLQSLIKTGRLLFSKKNKMLLEQLKYFPKGSHDDGPDALEMAVRLALGERGPRTGIILLVGDPDDRGSLGYSDQPVQDPNERDYGPNYNITDDGEDD